MQMDENESARMGDDHRTAFYGLIRFGKYGRTA
jgi:hypothetical protein